MERKRRFVGVVLVVAMVFGLARASEAEEIRLRVAGGKVDGVDVPVCTVIELSEQLAGVPAEEIAVELRQEGGKKVVPGQIVKVGDKKAELWWILPELKAQQGSAWTAVCSDRRLRSRVARPRGFLWQDKEGEYLDLLFDGRKVTRYMYAHDTSSPQRVFETYKPFHHVFDAEGQRLLTNGPDGENPYQGKITYPHHRGIFIGWNRLEHAGQRYDLWHMKEAHQVHQKFLQQVAGPVLGRSKSLIHWNNKSGEPVVAEEREVTVFQQGDPTVLLLEFNSELKAVRGDVSLDGDPEHAGFQYRPHNDVAAGGKEVKATYLFHEDGIDPRRDKDLPWVGMSYGLNGKQYSVQHINHPTNPKETVYSAYRDYGRFGAFFKKRIKAGETLSLRYRIWVLEGQMPRREDLASKYSVFVDSPRVEVLGG
jgi:hypothetical protein